MVGVDNSTLPDEGHTYDANGNRTGAGYAVGAGNRQLSDPRYNYTYDDEGNRTAKVDAITGERTEYVWDARNRLDDQVSVVTGANGAVTERYVYGPAVDQVLAVDSVGSQVLWMLSDQQGSIHMVISSAGTTRKTVEYDGFGKVMSDSSSHRNGSRISA